MSIFNLLIVIFLSGFIITLTFLHLFGIKLGVPNYDACSNENYRSYLEDDFKSNAQAYLFYSFVWIIFWIIVIFRFSYLGLLKFSEFIGYITKRK